MLIKTGSIQFALLLSALLMMIGQAIGQPNNPERVEGPEFLYNYPMDALEGLPASEILVPRFISQSWEWGEGCNDGRQQQLVRKAARGLTFRPSTPVFRVEFEEHSFIAQFYENAPGSYHALVLGDDGYYHDIRPEFVRVLSDPGFSCYGLPVTSTIKNTTLMPNGLKYVYYTTDVKTPTCHGNEMICLFLFSRGVSDDVKTQIMGEHHPISGCDFKNLELNVPLNH